MREGGGERGGGFGSQEFLADRLYKEFFLLKL